MRKQIDINILVTGIVGEAVWTVLECQSISVNQVFISLLTIAIS